MARGASDGMPEMLARAAARAARMLGARLNAQRNLHRARMARRSPHGARAAPAAGALACSACGEVAITCSKSAVAYRFQAPHAARMKFERETFAEKKKTTLAASVARAAPRAPLPRITIASAAAGKLASVAGTSAGFISGVAGIFSARRALRQRRRVAKDGGIFRAA